MLITIRYIGSRLLPRRADSIEGRRHKDALPIKLIRPQNSLMKDHADGHFATATVRYLKDFATLLGSDVVFFLSQDDKARIPIGLTAARKQAPLMMHLEYRIRLPDHDWVVAENHKLIPSVYACCKVDEGKLIFLYMRLNHSDPFFRRCLLRWPNLYCDSIS